MRQFLRLRVLIATLLVCLLLGFSFAVFTPKTLAASCRYGFTKPCVSVIPNTITSSGGCITFKLSGLHWNAGDTVKLSIVQSGSLFVSLGSAITNSAGGFTFSVSKLCGVSPGVYSLKAVDKLQGISSLSGFIVN